VYDFSLCMAYLLCDVTSMLHRSFILCQGGRYYSYAGRDSNHRLTNTDKYQRNSDMGRNPKEILVRDQPQREKPFSINVKGGEIETLIMSTIMNVIMTNCFHQ
jgi:hypothetical protein